MKENKAKKKVIKIKKMELSVSERHFGVILEDIDSKLDSVVEGNQALDKKIDKVDEKLEDFRGEVNFKFKVVQETLDSHTQILDSHTQMIAKNTEDLEIIKTDIEFIKNSLKKKVDIDEFSVLEKRVALLERKFQRA